VFCATFVLIFDSFLFCFFFSFCWCPFRVHFQVISEPWSFEPPHFGPLHPQDFLDATGCPVLVFAVRLLQAFSDLTSPTRCPFSYAVLQMKVTSCSTFSKPGQVRLTLLLPPIFFFFRLPFYRTTHVLLGGAPFIIDSAWLLQTPPSPHPMHFSPSPLPRFLSTVERQ